MAGDLFSGNRMFAGAGGASPNFRSKRPPMPTMTGMTGQMPTMTGMMPTMTGQMPPIRRQSDRRKRSVAALRGIGMDADRADFMADLLSRMGA